MRPFALPVIHRWQAIQAGRDERRRRLEERSRLEETVRTGTPILEDAHGCRFVLYPFDKSNLANVLARTADVKEFKAIPLLVRDGAVAFDVGANVGVYSVFLSRLCGPTGRVFSFEPVPDTYWRLRETLVLNRCENVVAVQVAICENGGTAQMNLFDDEFAEWNTLGKPKMTSSSGLTLQPKRSVSVPAYTLDQFCEANQVSQINLLKIDVEGFELHAFRGATRLLRERRIDCICFEISKDPLKGAGVESRDVFSALEEYGYLSYRFDMKTCRFEGPVHDTGEFWANFFASFNDLTKIDNTLRSNEVALYESASTLERLSQ